jgi:hypothetical protein
MLIDFNRTIPDKSKRDSRKPGSLSAETITMPAPVWM